MSVCRLSTPRRRCLVRHQMSTFVACLLRPSGPPLLTLSTSSTNMSASTTGSGMYELICARYAKSTMAWPNRLSSRPITVGQSTSLSSVVHGCLGCLCQGSLDMLFLPSKRSGFNRSLQPMNSEGPRQCSTTPAKPHPDLYPCFANSHTAANPIHCFYCSSGKWSRAFVRRVDLCQSATSD